jgi:hypothetical protein
MAPHGNTDSGDRLHGGTMLDEGAPPWVCCSRKEWLASADGLPPSPEAVGSVVGYWTARGTERPELSSRESVKCESAEQRSLERRAGRVSC